MVQSLAHDQWRGRRAEDGAGAGGAGARCVREAALPRPTAPFHRLRGRSGLRCTAQDHRGLPSVSRGECRGGGNREGQRHDRANERASRRRGHLLGGSHARRQAGRPSCGCRLAHAGQRQEFLHALLRRPRGAASGDAEPDAGGADRPQRPRRPAFRSVPTLRGHPRPDAGAGQRARASARAAEPGQRRRGFHHHP